MKKTIKLVVTAATVASLSFASYAGQWIQDAVGWWYQYDGGGYPISKWEVIDGKYYYFGENGYMLSNTITPDGYYVGTDGAWVQDAAQATQAETASTAQSNAQTGMPSEVWVSATGSKYHRINNCGKMNPNNARLIPLEKAQSYLSPCETCFGN